MKIRNISIFLVLGSSILFSTSGIAQENKIKTVDVKKIRAQKYTKFIEHIFWYRKELINSKKISNKQIPEDMQKFKDMLKKVMKSEYLLSEESIDSNTIAVEDLKDSNDYILLEYKYNNLNIQIQDGKALYIGIFPDKGLKIEQSDLAQYVKSVAFKIMNLPKLDEERQEPHVFTSILDIGDSKCGNIFYEANFDPFQSWDNYIMWWSDGRNILFLIGKASFSGIDYSRVAHIPESIVKAPRKFKKTK